MLSIRQNNFTTSLRRRYPTSLWSCHIVAVVTLDEVAKTTSLQRLIMTSPNETLQPRRFCNVFRHFHRNYIATSEQRRNNVVTTLLCLLGSSSPKKYLSLIKKCLSYANITVISPIFHENEFTVVDFKQKPNCLIPIFLNNGHL